MTDLYRRLRIWIFRRPYTIVFGLIGFIAAFLIAWLGWLKFFFILVVTVVFIGIGLFRDRGTRFRDFMKRFVVDKYK